MKASAKSVSMLAATAALVLSLAVQVNAGQTLRQVKEKWIGRKAAGLIAQHGDPDRVFETETGHQVFAYVKTKRHLYSVPVYIPPRTHEFDAYQPETGTYSYGVANAPGTWAFEYRTRETECTGYFEVDASGTVVGVRFKGEGCPN